MRNGAKLMLSTPAALVDNLAEKADECPLYQYCLHTVGSIKTELFVIRSSRMFAIEALK